MLIHDDQGKNGTDQEQQHQPEAVRMRGQQRQTCRSQEKNTQTVTGVLRWLGMNRSSLVWYNPFSA
jgi:hypothetical protein